MVLPGRVTGLVMAILLLVGCGQRFDVVVESADRDHWVFAEIDPGCSADIGARGVPLIELSTECKCTGHDLMEGPLVISYFGTRDGLEPTPLRRGVDIQQAAVVDLNDRRFFVAYFGHETSQGPGEALDEFFARQNRGPESGPCGDVSGAPSDGAMRVP